MAVHGSIGEYSDFIEDWTAYTERLENYFTANDVEDGLKKRAILLSVCGAATYKLIRSLAAPEKPKDHSYENLKQMVKTHHNPKPCRFKEAECHACGKKAHIAKVCRSKKAGSSLGASKTALKVQDSIDVADTLEYTLFPVSDQQAKPVLTTVLVDGKKLCM